MQLINNLIHTVCVINYREPMASSFLIVEHEMRLNICFKLCLNVCLNCVEISVSNWTEVLV